MFCIQVVRRLTDLPAVLHFTIDSQELDLKELAAQMRPPITDFYDFIGALRSECYLLKRGPKVYQLQTSSFSVGIQQSRVNEFQDG